MGYDIPSILTTPLSFKDCFVDGEVDINRYWNYKRRRGRKTNASQILTAIIKKTRKRKIDEPLVYNCRTRSVKKHKLMYRDDDGNLKEFTTSHTLWYLLYVNQEPQNKRQRNNFRNRFRMPYASYLDLAKMISDHELFHRWESLDGANHNSSDIKILLLGSLRYLGRGWTFDDIEEATCISAECHRQFLNVFLVYGSTVLYNLHVTSPAFNTDVSEFEKLFALAGYNGCIGESDGTHVGMLSCASWATIAHLGPKLNIPSRSYNATVTHCRQILGTTCGHPSTWNDKSIILYDDLVGGVHDGKYFCDHEFTLLEHDKSGNIVEIKYAGVWFMVDNGYLNWSTTIPPIKNAVTYKSIRFSEWLESMRKDVECTFGILKGRFCILRYGIRLRSIKKCDEIWKTCCALHNRLLFIDGLHKHWDQGMSSDWEHSNRKYQKNNVGKFAINRLQQNKSYNTRIDHGEINLQKDNADLDQYLVDGRRVVRKMPMKLFQECLIEHFDIRFQQNTVVWPSRCKTPTVI